MTRVGLRYSIDQLLRLRPTSLTGHSAIQPTQLWETLKHHGIHKHTVRGTRAGQNYIRPIQPIITHRTAPLPCKLTTPCWSNLVPVPCNGDVNKTLPHGKNLQPESQTKGNINICLLNPWSVCNKTTAICDFIIDHDIDLLALTETWLKGDSRDQVILQEILPPGCNMVQQARSDRGGGIAVIHREDIKIKCTSITNNGQFTSFEAIECDICVKQSAKLFVIYRPPPSSKNGLTYKMFLTQFADFLEQHIVCAKQLVLLGDFNLHVESAEDREAQGFRSLIERFGLTQHVQQCTHRNGHTLDLVISRSSESFVSNVSAQDHGFPDHYPVFSQLSLQRSLNTKQVVSFRKYKSVNVSNLVEDIKKSDLCGDLSTLSLNELVELYNSVLEGLMDVHAPLKTCVLTIRTEAEWYTSEVRVAKQERRQAERLWRKTGLTVHRDIYVDKRIKVNNLIKLSKTNHYQSRITECHDNTKQLFKVVNTLLGKDRGSSLPDRPIPDLLEDFSGFFVTKVQDIKSSIQALNTEPPVLQITQVNIPMTNFVPATAEEVRRLIFSSPSKQCSLDPLPTNLLKASSEQLIPFITQIVNASLATGEFPQEYKNALVTPLLKKPSLDPDIMKNFRPVSNLAYVSKILEKVVSTRLNKHLVDNKLEEPFQSAYRKGHSTETATLRVHNDIQCALGENKCILVVMLDLSAAFDTVDHQLMLSTLESLGISGTALEWFKSYLTQRSQCINIKGTRSKSQPLDCGVPQGSVLGPIMFTLYTSPLGSLLRQRGFYHMYADDSTLYLTFKPEQLHNNLSHMEETVDQVRQWMASYSLKMNDDKTEVMLITPKHISLQCPNLSIGQHSVTPSSCVRNLGVHMDSHSTMEHHVNTVCRAAYMHLHNISRIKAYLDKPSLERLIHAFVTSKLDYGNATLLGYPSTLLQRLQRVLNSAARLLSGCRKYDHITPVMRELHWLPVTQRIKFKVAVLVFKAKQGIAPIYLQDLIQPYVPNRSLRSANQELMRVPSTKSSLVAQRAFCVAGPTLWNSLPLELRQSKNLVTFKKKLKTFLFLQYYD